MSRPLAIDLFCGLGGWTDGLIAECGLERDGVKCGGDWFNSEQPSISRLTSSKSPARKFASAMIAKIPLPLARHIGATFSQSNFLTPTRTNEDGQWRLPKRA